jgi:hypothetical protein
MKIIQPALDESLKYYITRFEKAQDKAYHEKFKLALFLEAAVKDGYEDFSKYNISEEQLNAILDWKRDFEQYESEQEEIKNGKIALMDLRHEERKKKLKDRKKK